MAVWDNSVSSKFFRKIVSVVVIQAFLISNIAFAATPKTNIEQPKKQDIVTTPDSIIVPRDFGLVKNKYNGNSGKLVIHIQDAHCNYEAQSNIVRILEGLVKNYSLGLVSVEGADGFIDTSWFKAFPDDEVRKEVADYFMKKGEITGPEFLSITTNLPFKLFGAETRSYYIDNLNAFTASYPLKAETEKYFNSIKSALSRLKGIIYSDDLRALDAKIQDYDSKKLQFNDYVRYLQSVAEHHKINLRDYENFFRLVSVLIYEKKIDFNVTDKERSSLIDGMSKAMPKDALQKLVEQSIAFKSGKMSSAEYYAYLKGLAAVNNIDLGKKYPNLYNYIIYNAVYSKIENEKLFKDLKDIELAVKEKLFSNDDQRTLDKLSRHIDILLGLVNIKLMNGDFDYYQANKSQFTSEYFEDFIKKKVVQYGLAYEIDPPSNAIAKSIPELEKFYSIAIKRDKALVDNTLAAMKKEHQNIAVLVTGGFHSEGIAKLLEKEGVSYMVVCPSITKDVPTPYIEILTNQRTPLENILVGTAHAKEGSLTPPSRAELITISDNALEDYAGKLLDGDRLRLHIGELKGQWVEIIVKGIEGAPTPVGKVDIKGFVERTRGSTGASVFTIVNDLRAQLHERFGKLGLSKIAAEHLLGLLEEELLSPEFKSITAKFEQEYQRRAASKQSPGANAIAGRSKRPLQLEEFTLYDDNLTMSFEMPGEITTLDNEIPGLKVQVHGDTEGSFEDRIAAYNDKALVDGKPTIPFSRIHPGTWQGRTEQFHVSDYIWSRRTPEQKLRIGNHEKAHLAIYNKKGNVYKLWMLYLKYCAENKKAVDQEDFVENIQTWVGKLMDWAKEAKEAKEGGITIKFWAQENGIPLTLNTKDFENCQTSDIRTQILNEQGERVLKKIEEAIAKHNGTLLRVAFTEAYVLAANYGSTDIMGRIAERFSSIKNGPDFAMCKDTVFQVASFYPLWLHLDMFNNCTQDAKNVFLRWFQISGANNAVGPEGVVAVIMAGGGGERMWPVSTSNDPKQLAEIIDEPLLVMAVKRVAESLGAKNVYIQTVPHLKNRIIGLLTPLGIPDYNIFTEPKTADTAGAIGYAAAKLKQLGRGEDVMFVCTADHYIDVTSEAFRSSYMNAAKIAKHMPAIGTLGIDPEPIGRSEEYGCIEKGGDTFYTNDSAVIAATFIEKPKGADADRVFNDRLPDGAHRWLYNSGMFIGRPEVFLAAFRHVAPVYSRAFDAIAGANKKNAQDVEQKAFDELSRYKADKGFPHSAEPTGKRSGTSVDYVLAQPLSKVETDRIGLFMIPGVFKWKDIGGYKSAYEYYRDDYLDTARGAVTGGDIIERGNAYKDSNNNVVVSPNFSNISIEGCSNCFVMTNDENIKVKLTGLSNTVVVYNPITKVVMATTLNVKGEHIKDVSAAIAKHIATKGYVTGNPDDIRRPLRKLVFTKKLEGDNTVTVSGDGDSLIMYSKNSMAIIETGLGIVLDQDGISLNVSSQKEGRAPFVSVASISSQATAIGASAPQLSADERIEETRLLIDRGDINKVTSDAYAAIYGIDENTAVAEIPLICKDDVDTIIGLLDNLTKENDTLLKNMIESRAKKGTLTPAWVRLIIKGLEEEYSSTSQMRTRIIFVCNILISDGNEQLKNIVKEEKRRIMLDNEKITVSPDKYKRDSVRGEKAEEELTDAQVEKDAQAFVQIVLESYRRIERYKDMGFSDLNIVVGKESRQSGPRILAALKRGITSTGANVIDISNSTEEGVVSTPMIYFADHLLKPHAAIEVTASHLPSAANGLKPTIMQRNITEEEMKSWEGLTHKVIDGEIQFSPKTTGKIVENRDVLQYYHTMLSVTLIEAMDPKNVAGLIAKWKELREKALRKDISLKDAIDEITPLVKEYITGNKPLAGMTIEVDPGNGSAGPIVNPLLKSWGAIVPDAPTHTPDGIFKGEGRHDANPNIPDNLRILLARVAANNASLALAFDVDADRLAVVDDKGNILKGDDIAALVAPYLIRQYEAQMAGRPHRQAAVVMNVLCSDQLKQLVENAGGVTVESAVGFSKVKEMMINARQDYETLMGVELSSHLMFNTNFDSDDALFACVVLMGIMKKLSVEGNISSTQVMSAEREKMEGMYYKFNNIGEGRVKMVTNDDRKDVSVAVIEELLKRAENSVGKPDRYVVRNQLDGIKIDRFIGNKHIGWFAIRPSGTSAEIVITAESVVNIHGGVTTREEAERYSKIMEQEIAQLLKPYQDKINIETVEPSRLKENFEAVWSGKNIVEAAGATQTAKIRVSPGAYAVSTDTLYQDRYVPPDNIVSEFILNKYYTGENIVNALFKGKLQSDYLPILSVVVNESNRTYAAMTQAERDAAWPMLERFYAAIAERALSVKDIEVAKGLQIMIGNTIALQNMIDNKIQGAENITLTANPDEMLKALDANRGPSYINALSIPANMVVATKEGSQGLYWRGAEGVSKLGANVLNNMQYVKDNKPQLDRLVMYTMLHISGFHTTVFLHDRLPGSVQHVSTGKGHFQGKKLDIKYVTKGKVAQFNDLYNRHGTLSRTTVQVASEGERTMALPHSIDYMSPLTRIAVFNDVSVELTNPALIEKLNPFMSAKVPNDLVKHIPIESKMVNYTIIDFNGKPTLVENLQAISIVQIKYEVPSDMAGMTSLIEELNNTEPSLIPKLATSTLTPAPESKGKTLNVVGLKNDEVSRCITALKALLVNRLDPARPIKVLPLLKTYPWGLPIGAEGAINYILRNLDATNRLNEEEVAGEVAMITKTKISSSDRIGESWLGKGLVVTGGIQNLPAENLSIFAQDIYGTKNAEGRGPISGITAKLLQAGTDLSWQIHLGFAEKVTALEKTTVYVALSAKMSKEEFLKAVKEGRTDIFNEVTLNPGETLIVPAKCPHAYRAGSVVVEFKDIETDSPAETYSFYDRGRLTANEKRIISEAVRAAGYHTAAAKSAIETANPDLYKRLFDKKNPLIRPDKDGLTLSAETLEKIASDVENAGYLNKVEPSRLIMKTPILLTPLETRNEARAEIIGITEGSVGLKYTIQKGQSVRADVFSLGSGQPITVLEGAVRIKTDNNKEEIAEEGTQIIIPYSSKGYSIESLEGESVVVTSYMPLQPEVLVNMGFEAIRVNLDKIRMNKVCLVTTEKAFARGNEHTPGSWKYERNILNAISDGMVDVKAVEATSVEKLRDNLKGLVGAEKGVTYVVQLTENELDSIKGDPEIAKLLKDTRLMVLPNVKFTESRGIPFIREIESAGVILGNTTEKDITDKTMIAGWLKTVMSRLTGNNSIDWDTLSTLLKTPDPATFADRIKMLLEKLAVRIQPYEADKELRGRRELLWSV